MTPPVKPWTKRPSREQLADRANEYMAQGLDEASAIAKTKQDADPWRNHDSLYEMPISTLRNSLNALFLGHGADVSGAVAGIGSAIAAPFQGRNPIEAFKQSYATTKADEQARIDTGRQNSPWVTAAQELPGMAVGTVLGGGAKLLQGAPTVLGQIAQGAKVGLPWGMAQAALDQDLSGEPLVGPKESAGDAATRTIENMVLGGAKGAVVGGAMGGALHGLQKFANRVPATEAEQIVSRMLPGDVGPVPTQLEQQKPMMLIDKMGPEGQKLLTVAKQTESKNITSLLEQLRARHNAQLPRLEKDIMEALGGTPAFADATIGSVPPKNAAMIPVDAGLAERASAAGDYLYNQARAQPRVEYKRSNAVTQAAENPELSSPAAKTAWFNALRKSLLSSEMPKTTEVYGFTTRQRWESDLRRVMNGQDPEYVPDASVFHSAIPTPVVSRDMVEPTFATRKVGNVLDPGVQLVNALKERGFNAVRSPEGGRVISSDLGNRESAIKQQFAWSHRDLANRAKSLGINASEHGYVLDGEFYPKKLVDDIVRTPHMPSDIMAYKMMLPDGYDAALVETFQQNLNRQIDLMKPGEAQQQLINARKELLASFDEAVPAYRLARDQYAYAQSLIEQVRQGGSVQDAQTALLQMAPMKADATARAKAHGLNVQQEIANETLPYRLAAGYKQLNEATSKKTSLPTTDIVDGAPKVAVQPDYLQALFAGENQGDITTSIWRAIAQDPSAYSDLIQKAGIEAQMAQSSNTASTSTQPVELVKHKDPSFRRFISDVTGGRFRLGGINATVSYIKDLQRAFGTRTGAEIAQIIKVSTSSPEAYNAQVRKLLAIKAFSESNSPALPWIGSFLRTAAAKQIQ